MTCLVPSACPASVACLCRWLRSVNVPFALLIFVLVSCSHIYHLIFINWFELYLWLYCWFPGGFLLNVFSRTNCFSENVILRQNIVWRLYVWYAVKEIPDKTCCNLLLGFKYDFIQMLISITVTLNGVIVFRDLVSNYRIDKRIYII
jgi:hypothetical protein